MEPSLKLARKSAKVMGRKQLEKEYVNMYAAYVRVMNERDAHEQFIRDIRRVFVELLSRDFVREVET